MFESEVEAGATNASFQVPVSEMKLWSLDDPYSMGLLHQLSLRESLMRSIPIWYAQDLSCFRSRQGFYLCCLNNETALS